MANAMMACEGVLAEALSKGLPRSFPIHDTIRAEVIMSPVYPQGQGPEDDHSVLRLNKGDIVYVLEQHPSGWWGGHKEGDEVTGWFPGSIAQPTAGDSREYDGDDENSRAFELHTPITTSDHRAVASPQKSRQYEQTQIKRLTEELALERKLVKDLESSVAAERDKKEELAEKVRRLEADSSRLRKERDVERKLSAEERKREERKEAEAQTQAATVALMQEDLKRKDEMIQQLQAQLRQFEVQRESEVSSLRIDAERIVESSLLSDGHGTPRGSAAREDAARIRIASTSVTRQLFTQPISDDVPPNSARGISRHGSEPLQGAPVAQLHGRIASTIPPRPSPRGAQQSLSNQATPVQPWRSLSNGPPTAAQLCTNAASPRCGVKASIAGSDLRGPAPQVRSIISEIERRSTSQTPGPISRMADPSPAATPHRGQTLMANATVRSASATVGGTSRSAPVTVTTAVARAEPSRGRHFELDGSDHPQNSPKALEDSSLQVVFGMSPMGRPRGDKKPLRAGHVSTPSPTPKGPSINDRIRALYAHHK